MATEYKVKIDAVKLRAEVVEGICKYLDTVKRNLRAGAPLLDYIEVVPPVFVKKPKGGKHVA